MMGRWVGQPTTVPIRRPSPEVTAAAATPMPSWRRPLAPTTPAPLTDRAPGPNARPPRRRSPTSPAHPNRAGWRGRRAGRPATAASSWCGSRRPATATLSSKHMAADNHTTIVGNLVDDPELRFTNTGIAAGHRRSHCSLCSAAFGNVCPDQREGRHERLTDRRADHVGGGLPVASNSNRPSTSAAPPDGQRIGVRSGWRRSSTRRS